MLVQSQTRRIQRGGPIQSKGPFNRRAILVTGMLCTLTNTAHSIHGDLMMSFTKSPLVFVSKKLVGAVLRVRGKKIGIPSIPANSVYS